MSQTLPSSSPHCAPRPLSIQHCFKATFRKGRRPYYVGGIRVRSSSNESGSKAASGISEDMLQRLRLAEEEARKLREELAKAKAEALERGDQTVAEKADESLEAIRTGRIDAGDLKRLSPFSGGADSWLRERDVSFLIGKGPGESSTAADAPRSDAADTVKRRLLIGVAATVALGAFALVPTDSLRLGKPSKPLFLYLIPLIRVQALLGDVREIVAAARWGELDNALSRIQGMPNNFESNIRDAAYSIEDPKAWGIEDSKAREKAELIARELIEYINSIDYQKYFDAMGRPGSRGGDKEKQFSDFSIRAVDAAQAKLREFLALMPRDAVAAAKEQASVPMGVL